MNHLAVAESRIPAMTGEAIARVRELEERAREFPQAEIATHHVLHAGVYARTITIPAGVMLTGALIRVPTVLIVNGHCSVWVGDDARELSGYHVLAASAGRKQAFYAFADTELTMAFATQAQTVEQAEDEFSTEAHLLMSRQPGAVNHIHITGE